MTADEVIRFLRCFPPDARVSWYDTMMQSVLMVSTDDRAESLVRRAGSSSVVTASYERVSLDEYERICREREGSG